MFSMLLVPYAISTSEIILYDILFAELPFRFIHFSYQVCIFALHIYTVFILPIFTQIFHHELFLWDRDIFLPSSIVQANLHSEFEAMFT